MRIAIISDTHSRYDAIESALRLLEPHKVDLILHCGDIEDSEAVWLFPPNTHFVFGNCDSERSALRQAIHGIGATLYEPLGKMDLDGVRIAWLHGDDTRLLRRTTEAEEFDFLFHGHTHIAEDRQNGRTRVINPGALHRVRQKTLVVLDLQNGQAETVEVE